LYHDNSAISGKWCRLTMFSSKTNNIVLKMNVIFLTYLLDLFSLPEIMMAHFYLPLPTFCFSVFRTAISYCQNKSTPNILSLFSYFQKGTSSPPSHHKLSFYYLFFREYFHSLFFSINLLFYSAFHTYSF
jgi:hypothetical protein